MVLPSPPGNFIKLMILAYADATYSQPTGMPYFALVNPHGFQTNYSIEYSKSTQAPGQKPPPMVYVYTKPTTLTFNFLFDTTGAIIDPNPAHVIQTLDMQITSFITQFFQTDGDTHAPPCLKIIWGPNIFNGVFRSISADYKLFDPTGTPIRAVLTCAFEQSMATSLLSDALSALSSPDLTHSRVVNAGDTLPLFCHEIYGDSSYYLQVAQFNNISNFRNLKIGSTLYFPPLSNQ